MESLLSQPALGGVECSKCKAKIGRGKLRANLYICPNCGRYMTVPCEERLDMILDVGSQKSLDLKPPKNLNPLNFPGYPEKLKDTRKRTGLADAVITAEGRIDNHPCVIAILDSRFFMGSMGSVVGERVTQAIEYADRKKYPLIIFSASGGARMQEGIFSLMQMAKTSAAIARFSAAGGLFISYLTHPTTGGVTASFASLGDITLAEPGALIGFTGPRVIEQTIGTKLPEGFQRSEFQEAHGFVDEIVERKDMKETLARLLRLHDTSYEVPKRA